MNRIALSLALVLLSAVVSFAQDAEPEAEKPINIDFVRKDIHVVMKYLGLKSGWTIKVDEDVKLEITIILRNGAWLDAVTSICNSNDLTYDIDDATKTITVHRNAGKYSKWQEVSYDAKSGKLTACFVRVGVWEAILCIAGSSQTACWLESPLGDGHEWKKGRFVYGNTRASFYTDEMTVEEAMRVLARQGDLKMTRRIMDSKNEGWIFEPIPLK